MTFIATNNDRTMVYDDDGEHVGTVQPDVYGGSQWEAWTPPTSGGGWDVSSHPTRDDALAALGYFEG